MKVLTQVGTPLVGCELPPPSDDYYVNVIPCPGSPGPNYIPDGVWPDIFMCFFHIFRRQVVGQVPLVHRLLLVNPNFVTKLSKVDFVGGI